MDGRMAVIEEKMKETMPIYDSTDNSLHAHHLRVVKALKERGEKVVRPPITLWKDKTPDVYAKTEPELQIGSGLMQKDGRIMILGEFLTWEAGPYDIEEIGLIDAHAFYESEKTQAYLMKKKMKRGIY
jgi:hypothetical protein